MSELKITTEKVLSAAKKCSQAKEVLKVLFPEAFKNDVSHMLNKGRGLYNLTEFLGCDLNVEIYRRIKGNNANEKAITILNLIEKVYD